VTTETAIAPTKPELCRVVEAIVFVAENPVSPSEIVQALARTEMYRCKSPQQEQELTVSVTDALGQLRAQYMEQPTALELRIVAGGYQFYSKAEYVSYVREAIVAREARKLSRTVLETLAIIAYRQPVSKSEMDYLRGVDCGYALAKLLEKQLIEPAGRASTPGRPLTYRTSGAFMEYFGIQSLDDLPKLKEVSLAEEQTDELYRTKLAEQQLAVPYAETSAQHSDLESPDDPADVTEPTAPTVDSDTQLE
jgi:segregation and condensation protein B